MVAREGVESSFLKGAKDLNRLKILKVLDSVGELDRSIKKELPKAVFLKS